MEFKGSSNKDKILHFGPWFLNGHLVIIRQWEPGMELKKNLLKSIPV